MIKKLLLGRVYYGFGDWVMFTSVIKHINRQYPEIVIDIDTSRLPLQFLQYAAYFDIRVTPVCRPDPRNYDVYIPHVVYGASRTFRIHLLESMLHCVNKGTGLDLQYDMPASLAQYIGPMPESIPLMPRTEGYVIVAPEGGVAKTSRCKDWGMNNFQELITALYEKTEIVQLSTSKYPMLAGCYHHVKDATLGAMLRLMKLSRAVVTLENGIMHFAGHHGVRCYTIFRPGAPTKPSNVSYPNQVALDDEIIDPVVLADRIAAEFKPLTAPRALPEKDEVFVL